MNRRGSFLWCLQALLPLAFCIYYTSAFYGIGVNKFYRVVLLHPRNRLADSSSAESSISFDDEETLLRVHLSVLPGQVKEDAIDKVKKFCQAFPFAAVLPVQPLTYLPTDDGGVEVKFLRKKTKEKGSIDGGMRFFISENEKSLIYVVVKRNSEGQTVPKMFSEKLVVQAFVKGIAGETPDKTNPAPIDAVVLESVFHKWLNV